MKKILFILCFLSVIIISPNISAATINVPVLCYHSVSTNPLLLDSYTISPDELENDILYFKSIGYNFITPSELPNIKSDNNNIILSFDDGYEDFYENVYPLLKKYNAKAIVYVIGSKIDKTNYLKKWQIKELDESGLVEIGNHSDIFHNRSKDILMKWYSDTFMLKEAIYDIGKCNQRLYDIIGHYPVSVSYPFGAYTNKLEQMVKDELMFLTSATTNYGIVKYSTDIYKPLNRLYRIHGDTPQSINQTISSLK